MKPSSQLMWLWCLSHRQPAKVQKSLRICAVSLEPSLFAHMKYGSRQRVRPKIRHLAPFILANQGSNRCTIFPLEAVHAPLKNEFMEDEKYHKFMKWLSKSWPSGGTIEANVERTECVVATELGWVIHVLQFKGNSPPSRPLPSNSPTYLHRSKRLWLFTLFWIWNPAQIMLCKLCVLIFMPPVSARRGHKAFRLSVCAYIRRPG